MLLTVLDQASPTDRTLTIAGPDAYTYPSLIRAIGKWTGKRKWLMPLPHVVVATVPWLATLLRVNRGPVPDQVPRLYVPKDDKSARLAPAYGDQYVSTCYQWRK